MFKNYFKVALRNIKRKKVYSIINIVGLGVGMACTILILLWVQDELSYDQFHAKVDRLYRVIESEKLTSGKVLSYAVHPPALAPILVADFPEIVNATRYKTLGSRAIQYKDKSFFENGFAFVDSELFELFTFPFIKGNPQTALSDPYSIVLTEEMAQKYFDDIDPIGKTLRVDNRFDFRVSGILKNIPGNSHLRFNFAIPFSIIKEYDRPIEGWDTYFANTYILLDQHADAEALNEKIADVIKKHDPETLAVLSLQPISRIHLYSGDIMGFGGAGDIRYVIIFSIIAMFILMMACINFMNLTTARSGDRAREIGMRKVVGASRRALIRQFFGESIILSFIALLLSIVLITLLLPVFNSISGKELAFQFSSNSTVYLGLIGITLITGIVAGTYPALFLSAFKPVHVLKSGLKPGSRNSRFRKILVIFQFMLTTALLIGTIVVYRQLNFIRNQKLGYEKEHLLYLRLPGDIRTKTELFKNEFIKIPNVQSASATSDDLAGLHASIILADWEGRNSDNQFALHLFWADPDFLKTFQIELADGRFFSKEFTADTANSIIMNEAAIRAMGMDSPIGKRVFEKGNIIGVIKDFHYTSLHQPIGPLVIIYSPEQFQFLFIKITGENVPKTIRELEQSWNRLAGGIPFDFHFLDETIDNMYQADRRFSKIINTFTILALFIACLGVFGMASFMAEQRSKEIGIRKVLGASVSSILSLLTKNFIKWVFLANLIAWPIAYYAMNKWLQNFAYRIDIMIWPFLLAGLAVLVITLLTVGWQAIRAATANPVDALKYE